LAVNPQITNHAVEVVVVVALSAAAVAALSEEAEPIMSLTTSGV